MTSRSEISRVDAVARLREEEADFRQEVAGVAARSAGGGSEAVRWIGALVAAMATARAACRAARCTIGRDRTESDRCSTRDAQIAV